MSSFPLRRGVLLVVLLSSPLGCSKPQAPASSSSSPAADAAAPSTASSVITGRVGSSAIVELEPVATELPLPEGPVIMDQYGKAFVPELLVARVGQTVEFRNSEDIDHNIQVLRRPTGTTVMTESGSQGEIFRRTFEAGVYDVSCDVHPGMRGIIIASRTPYVAMADDRGEFNFSNVPSGRYTLKVTEDGRVKSQEIDVQGPRTLIPAATR